MEQENNFKYYQTENSEVEERDESNAKDELQTQKKQAEAWFQKNILRILISKVDNALLSYKGKFDATKLIDKSISDKNNPINQNSDILGTDGYLAKNGLLQSYPFSFLSSGGNSAGSAISMGLDIQNIIQSISDKIRCFDEPTFQNFLNPIIQNILSGCRKGNIACRFANLNSDKTEQLFIHNEESIKLQQLKEVYEPQINELNAKIQTTSVLYQNNPHQQFQQEIQGLQTLQQSLTAEYQSSQKKITDEYQLIQDRHNIKMRNFRLLLDKATEIVNATLSEEENYANIFETLKTLVTNGIAVIEFDFDERGNLNIRNINRPELCFFDTWAKKKDRSDSRYCGKIITKSKVELSEKFNLSEKETDNLIDFIGTSNFADFLLNINSSTNGKKEFICICEYYTKDNQGNIFKYILSGNKILSKEKLSKEYNNTFPLLLIDNSNPEEYKIATMMEDFFMPQKKINKYSQELSIKILNSCSGKMGFPVDSNDTVTIEALRSLTFKNSPVMFIPKASTDSLKVTTDEPVTINPTQIDGTILQSYLSEYQNFLNNINNFILNNQITNNQSGTLGVLSGSAIENSQLNRENILAENIGIILQALKKIFKQCVIINIVELLNKNVNKYSSIDKFLVEEMTKRDNQEYRYLMERVSFDLEWIIDTSIRRNNTLQSLKELLQLIPQDSNVINPVIISIVENLDLISDSNTLIEAIEEAQRKPKSPQIDPLKQQELSMIQQQNDVNNQIKMQEIQSSNENKKMEISSKMEIEQAKLKFDYSKHLDELKLKDKELADKKEIAETQNYISMANNSIIHHNNITANELARLAMEAQKVGKIASKE